MSSTNALKNTWFVIMAGGIGSRFWPASRESQPKQFLDILGTGRSLIQMTYDRISPLVPDNQIIVMTNEQYQHLTASHLPEIPTENILTEPSRQNTAPCVAYVSFHIAARHPEANMVILPADHVITREQVFQNTLTSALQYVSQNPDILTLGMTPHRPDTGYGYIQLGLKTENSSIFQVAAFREKPTLDRAKKYLADKDHVWNSGIFISKVTTMKAAFESHAPEIFSVLNAPGIYASSEEKEFIQDRYSATPSISIDYAIMEKANNIVCFVVDIGWSDIGTWRSLYDLRKNDKRDIVINRSEGEYTILESKTLMIHSSNGKKVLIKGLEKMLVVDQEDILMIWPIDEEQEIKNIRDQLGEKWNLK